MKIKNFQGANKSFKDLLHKKSNPFLCAENHEGDF